jgi:hypothetical protein
VSSVINPVGPEEPSTYWRRRALVIVVLLVILALFWLLVRVALGSSDEPAEVAASPSPSFGLTITPEPEASASASPAASASPGEASASASASASAAPSPSASVSCADSDISVVAGTSAASTSVGAGMGLTLSVENTGDTACARDFGAGANEIRITSGSVLVWSSDFCNPSKAEDIVTLGPGEGRTTSVTWPGTVTAESCPADQPTAQPGSYRVVARNGSVESEPVTFTVK